MAVVVAGNVFDGLVIWGPFDDKEQANEWADQELRHAEWHVVEILNPEAS